MGLDAYVNKINKEAIPDGVAVDFDIDLDRWATEEVMYWRKFSALQGWMQKKYIQLGGTELDFNGPPLLLNVELLQELKHDLKNKLIEETQGFFFGEMDDFKWKQLRSDVNVMITKIVENPHHKFYYDASY